MCKAVIIRLEMMLDIKVSKIWTHVSYLGTFIRSIILCKGVQNEQTSTWTIFLLMQLLFILFYTQILFRGTSLKWFEYAIVRILKTVLWSHLRLYSLSDKLHRVR